MCLQLNVIIEEKEEQTPNNVDTFNITFVLLEDELMMDL